MITKNEISSLNLSPTKKDFVQIWNELIEVASKITERWDPTSTNESDPGIVLLKVLTGIADKLNYNIDKNIFYRYVRDKVNEEYLVLFPDNYFPHDWYKIKNEAYDFENNDLDYTTLDYQTCFYIHLSCNI